MLRAELRVTLPFAEERALHRAAAGWYAANGLPSDALTHAIAGSDWVSAERLFMQYWLELAGSGPRAMTARDGDPAAAGHRRAAHARLRPRPAAATPATWSACPRSSGSANAGSARRRRPCRPRSSRRCGSRRPLAAENPERAGEAAARLLERTEDAAGEHVYATSPTRPRAVAHLTFAGSGGGGGRLDEADAALERGADLARKSGFNLLTVQANRLQALAHLSRGRLSAAAACARRVLDSCRDAGIAESRNISYARLVLATVCRERGQLDEARFHIEESVSANAVPDPDGWVSGAIALALLLFDRGDHTGALEALEPLLDSRVGVDAALRGRHRRALYAELCLHDGRIDRAHTVIAEARAVLAGVRRAAADPRPPAPCRWPPGRRRAAADRVLANEPGSLVTAVSATVLLAQALRQLGDVGAASEQLGPGAADGRAGRHPPAVPGARHLDRGGPRVAAGADRRPPAELEHD